MRDQRFYTIAMACAALAVITGGFALAAAPPAAAPAPAPSTSSLHLSIVPAAGMSEATYSSLHVMVRHGPVTITIENRDMASHGFDAPALGIYIDIPAGTTVTYSATIAHTGLYSWYCWHPCPGDASPLASGQGMTGDLVVV